MTLSISDTETLLQRFPGLHIGIIGDFCLDVYLMIDREASEISLETGLPTQPVAVQRYSLGGAANVANNLRAMGVGTVRAFGVTGDDPFGKKMRRLMEEAGILTSELRVQRDLWDTHVFTKLYFGDEEQPRIDFGNFNKLAPDSGKLLLEGLERWLPSMDILIVNQQVLSGIHSTAFREQLADLLSRRGKTRSIVDSRSYSDELPMCIHKINGREAAVLCGEKPSPDSSISLEKARRIGTDLHQRWGQALFLTRGENGCLVFDENGCAEVPGLLLLSRTDPVGAGDSFLAGIAAVLAAGGTPRQAAALGNLAAGVTVQKLFVTGTASPGEILAMANESGYRYHPELASAPLRARYYRDTEIEIIEEPLRSQDITDAIFDHDGTISTLRQGWEGVMEPVMVRSILGQKLEQIDGEGYSRVVERVRQYIDRTTGVQTLVQMRGLVEMVRELGYVEEEKILDEHGYKEIFNRELMLKIDERLAKVERGELDSRDFTIKNALPFLESLRERGVRLYLASGTDQKDVEREAEILGYADLFEGRIYGAIGDIAHEPKKKVLETILHDIDRSHRGQVVTFGDGPVEIQETRRAGGLPVGVASNEVRRYGLNPAKRSRLIEAGAWIVAPDFSQMKELLEILFSKKNRET